MKDTLYANTYEAVGEFQFDQSVVAVFPDMIQRSVPGYQTILTGIGELTQLYAQTNTNLYDLGCSLGAVSLTMRRHAATGCHIIGVDNSSAMIQRAQEHIEGFHSDIPVTLVCDDLENININNASIVIINFTLQFIDPKHRQALINKIYQGLNPNGILILSEKIHFDDSEVQTAIEHLHLQFKRANGYSELEIGQKRASLENVLISDNQTQHLERLKKAGFQQSSIWFQAYNFVSFIAIKTP